ncbi:MAG: glutamate dehydrogenase [Thermofilaceae archaeon]|nr:glutamate dehydrogenase [Thermofilaceae archaeon]MCX8179961.1 glutamate dehydrogenase [Thermofilaceae archaeon]
MAAYWAWKMGFKVVALSDSKGTVYDLDGINVEKAIEVKKETGTVVEYPGKGQSRDVREALYVEADVVAPDALENQLTSENAHLVKARIVVEGANGPTTPEAEQILVEKGVAVIPDMLANAGGVAASYFEWVQNIQRLSWSEEETRAKLAELMETNFKRVLSQWRKLQLEHKRVTLRDAAVVASLQRIYNAMISRGWL